MHRVVLAVAVVMVSACKADDPFICASDDQCRRSGFNGGKCEASSNCSFTDIDCPTGRRYDVLANQSGECVVDDDSDMIADDGDNCPGLANTDQANEDQDRFGDPCDPCPPFSETSEGAGDDDGDGVDNLCDPRPTTAGDQILFFAGFHEVLDLAVWDINGSAIVENDGLTLQNTSDATLLRLSAGSETLMVGVTMKNAPTRGVWLGLPYHGGVGGAFCQLTTSKLELWAAGAPDRILEMTAYAPQLDREYIYSIQRASAMQHTCGVAATASAPPTQVMGMTTNTATLPRIMFGADATTHFGWVLLVKN
ncbi:MAG TPA: hypothetical protein VIV11_34330 [Kofleriaceae bacterium]